MKRRGEKIVTERLVLLPFAEAEADELLRLFRDASVRRYLLDDTMVTAEWMKGEIAASRGRFARSGMGLWSVRTKGQNQIIGFGGFRDFFDPPQLQLLYGLLPAYWGRGLATATAAAICDYAFGDLGLGSVTAAIDVPNTASKRVLERLGMRLEQVTIEDGAETAFYALRREDWEARNASEGAL